MDFGLAKDFAAPDGEGKNLCFLEAGLGTSSLYPCSSSLLLWAKHTESSQKELLCGRRLESTGTKAKTKSLTVYD